MANFSDLVKNFTPSLIGSLAGAATGAGAGYFTASQEDGETPEEFQARRMRNAATYGLAGGAVGAAVPAVGGAISSATEQPGPVGNVAKYLTGLGAGGATGVAAGGTIGGLGTKILNRLEDPWQAALDHKNKLITNAEGTLTEVAKNHNPLSKAYIDAQDEVLRHRKEFGELDTLLSAEKRRNFLARIFNPGQEAKIIALNGEKALAGVRGARRGGLAGLAIAAFPGVYDHTVVPLADWATGNR